MAYNDSMFIMGMFETISHGENKMSRTVELYESIENLVYVALEHGANTTSDVYGYVTQYAPKSLVSYDMIEKILEDMNDYDADNVY